MKEKTSSEKNYPKGSTSQIIHVIGVTLAIIIGFLLLWYAIDSILLAFTGILLAVLLNSLGKAFSQLTHLPYRLALAIVLIIFVGGLTLFFWLLAPMIGNQFQELTTQLPKAFLKLKEYAVSYLDWEPFSQEKLKTSFIDFLSKNESFFLKATTFFSTTFGVIASFFIFIFLGFYLAFDPKTYIRGFLALFPSDKRVYIGSVLSKIGSVLHWWLLGTFISMSIIGIFTFLGLWFLKIPLALILGFLAGLLTFIPIFGPIISAIPAVLIGLAHSPASALNVIILFIGVQSLESLFITPIIHQQTISVPPGLTIITQITLGLLIGFIGLALATPLLVVFIVLVQEFHVKKYH